MIEIVEAISEAKYELQWIEAEIALAIIEYENEKWLHSKSKEA